MKPLYQLSFGVACLILTATLLSCHSAAEEPSGDIKQELARGNRRFVTMHPAHPNESKKRRAELAEGQHPVAAVICCSDSRVPPEVIFDQGLGDLFVVRTAGNLMGGLELGSLEYAVEHLGVKLVIVMGHKECGAIKAFVQGGEAQGHIRDIVDSIRAEAEIQGMDPVSQHTLDRCIRANIMHGLHQLDRQSALISEKVEKGELEVVGALYDLRQGLVSWIKE